MSNYLTYGHLITPLHTGGSVQEGNLMGIAREVHTEFPYLPASSLRGKIRAELGAIHPDEVDIFFGQKIKDGQQPTEGEVWFADATLLFFPIASLNHHLIWITCPLWLERWNRWFKSAPLTKSLKIVRDSLVSGKSALVSFPTSELYLQTALLKAAHLEQFDFPEISEIKPLFESSSLVWQIQDRLVILGDEDCIALVDMGLQREVRVALEEESKKVKGGSFRAEEAIPPETILFFPWGTKPEKEENQTTEIRKGIVDILKDRLQFGGLEGLGRGWTDLITVEL